MKTPVDSRAASFADGNAVSRTGGATPSTTQQPMRGWLRVLAWLGLGCIGAAKPGRCSEQCAAGCVRKPAIVRRRVKAATPRARPMLPRSAAGALAGRPDEALKQALGWFSSPGPRTQDRQRGD